MNPLKLALAAASCVLYLLDEAWKALNPNPPVVVVDGIGPWASVEDVDL